MKSNALEILSVRPASMAISMASRSLWSPLEGSRVSYAYRPTTASLIDPKLKDKAKKTEIVPMYFSQMAVKIKDSEAAYDLPAVNLGATTMTDAYGSSFPLLQQRKSAISLACRCTRPERMWL